MRLLIASLVQISARPRQLNSIRIPTQNGQWVIADLLALVDYGASRENLNYIDRTRIGATGHSAGGNAACELFRQAGAANQPAEQAAFRLRVQLCSDLDRRGPRGRALNSGLPPVAAVDRVELGRHYGDKDERTLRAVHNERSCFPSNPI